MPSLTSLSMTMANAQTLPTLPSTLPMVMLFPSSPSVQLQWQGFWLLIRSQCNCWSMRMHATMMANGHNDSPTNPSTNCNDPHPAIPYAPATLVQMQQWGLLLISNWWSHWSMWLHATSTTNDHDNGCTTASFNWTKPQMNTRMILTLTSLHISKSLFTLIWMNNLTFYPHPLIFTNDPWVIMTRVFCRHMAKLIAMISNLIGKIDLLTAAITCPQISPLGPTTTANTIPVPWLLLSCTPPSPQQYTVLGFSSLGALLSRVIISLESN